MLDQNATMLDKPSHFSDHLSTFIIPTGYSYIHTYVYVTPSNLEVQYYKCDVTQLIYYKKLKCCLSVCIFPHHADNSVISAWILIPMVSGINFVLLISKTYLLAIQAPKIHHCPSILPFCLTLIFKALQLHTSFVLLQIISIQ